MPLKRETRLIIIAIFTSTFFLVELIVGYAAGSIALIADSFHMLSDVISIIVAFVTLNMASKSTASPNYTYGLQRAEVLGALINGVSLLTLSFTIIIEAIQRFFEPVKMEHPNLVIIVGVVGLVFNLVGMGLFHDHHHHHGPSDHYHEPSDVVSSSKNLDEIVIEEELDRDFGLHERHESHISIHPALEIRAEVMQAAELMKSENELHSFPHDHSSHGHSSHHDHHGDSHSRDHSHGGHGHSHSHGHDHSHGGHSHNLNDHGVFLHILGDALGSVGVVISSVIILLATGDWKYYMDPIFSILITLMIIISTLPLVKSASFILLQGVPPSIRYDKLKKEIFEISGVVGIHELHIWQLSDTKTIASVHVIVSEPKINLIPTYKDVSAAIKRVLHGHGIHSTTVQTEFLPLNLREGGDSCNSTVRDPNGEEDANEFECLLTCNESSCQTQVCCPK